MKVLQNIKNFFKKHEQIIVYTASGLSLLCTLIIIGSLISFAIGNSNSTATTPTEPSTTLSASNGNSSDDDTTASNESDTTTKDETVTTTKPNDKEDTTTKEEETTTPDGEEPTTKDTLPYLIEVNTALNCVTIYEKDSSGKYTIPYKSMICSTGTSGALTPLGTFKLGDIHSWTKIGDNEHIQCGIKFNGPYMFHTVPYTSMKNGTLDAASYNTLGENSTAGNIQLSVADMLWIRKHCPSGTPVEIYADATKPGPLGRPKAIKIPLDSPFKGWDPTDPSEDNPWNKLKPSVTPKSTDITIGYGATTEQFLSHFTILDTCGNDATSMVELNGGFDLNKPGVYDIVITVDDALNRIAEITVKVTVTSSKYEETTTENTTTEDATTEDSTTEEDTTEESTTEDVTTETSTTEATTTKEETTTTKENPSDIEATSETTTPSVETTTSAEEETTTKTESTTLNVEPSGEDL